LKARQTSVGEVTASREALSFLAAFGHSAAAVDLSTKRFIAAHPKEIAVLEAVLRAQTSADRAHVEVIVQNVQDRRAFCSELLRLKETPALPNTCGERVQSIFAVRDALAKRLGVPLTSTAQERLAFAGWCVFEQYKTRMYLPTDAIRAASRGYDIDTADFFEYLVPFAAVGGGRKGVFTTPKLRQAESNIASCLRGASVVSAYDDNDANRAADDEVHGVHMDAVQRQHLALCLQSPVSCIAGGAGVGKTTLLGAMVQRLARPCPDQGPANLNNLNNLNDLNNRVISVVCMAFTHKARRCLQAKLVPQVDPVLDEARPAQAAQDVVQVQTIHAYVAHLQRTLVSGELLKAARPVFFIIDEASMIDVELFASLSSCLLAMKAACPRFAYQFCIVGDDGQLPPIDRGELFRELCSQQADAALREPGREEPFGGLVVPVHRLTKCYRTDAIDLFDACNAMRHGVLVELNSASWKYLKVGSDDDIRVALEDIIGEQCRASDRVVQYIAWQNKDVRVINACVQEAMLAAGRVGPATWRANGRCVFHLGDRVVYGGEQQQQQQQQVTKPAAAGGPNSSMLTNAMTGTVQEVIRMSGAPVGVRIAWDASGVPDTVVRASSSKLLQDISLAYCLTVHKAQGSEYDNIVVPCFEVEKMMHCLDRRWLYTAVTRAKVQATILATPALSQFVERPICALPVSGLFY
jgi:exodeoxyribonuclease V alpha subunit